MSQVETCWFDISQVGDGQNLTGGNGEYWLEISNSQNNHVGRDGTVTGVKVKLTAISPLLGIYFFVARYVSGTTWEIIGKSQEITSGWAIGVNEFEFTTPIDNVRSSDLIGMAAYCANGDSIWKALTTTDTFPIDDSSTARMYFYDSNSTSYATVAVGAQLDFAIGGSVFGVMPLTAMMDPPVVMVVGDSISEGSPLNRCYRTNVTTKDRMGCYLHIAFRQLGWEWQIGGNTQLSNNMSETLTYDLTSDVWDKTPETVLVHCGVNDIQDARTWTQVEDALDDILTACRANDAALILMAIFPWTNGTHAQNSTRDTWNLAYKDWARAKSDVTFIDINYALGQERLTATGGDPTPTSGNLWDLVDDFAEDGTHLSAVGCAAAGAALAAELGRAASTWCDLRSIRGDENAAAALAIAAAKLANKAIQNKSTGVLTIRNYDDDDDLHTVTFTDDGTEITRSIESA